MLEFYDIAVSTKEPFLTYAKSEIKTVLNETFLKKLVGKPITFDANSKKVKKSNWPNQNTKNKFLSGNLTYIISSYVSDKDTIKIYCYYALNINDLKNEVQPKVISKSKDVITTKDEPAKSKFIDPGDILPDGTIDNSNKLSYYKQKKLLAQQQSKK